MRPVLKIPRRFDTAPDKIEGDMNRMVNALYDYAGELATLGAVKPEVPSKIIRSGTCAASYDVMLRVQPAVDTVVTVQMPQPETTDGGRVLRVARLGYDGDVVLSPLGRSLINDRSSLHMYSVPGLAEVYFDGVNFYTSYQGAMGWGEGL